VADVVLDASALLTVLFREPGQDHVLACPDALICAVNYAEVAGKLVDYGAFETDMAEVLRRTNCQVEALDERRAVAAAQLRRIPAARALSLGDRCCLALALQSGLPVLTADRAWADLEIGVEVRLIR
jgi:ribonuclease VapC